MHVYLCIICVRTNGLCWHSYTERILKLQNPTLKLGIAWTKVHFANGFRRYLLTAEECRGGGLLGSMWALVGPGPIHSLPPDQALLSGSPCPPTPCFVSSLLVSCSLLLRCLCQAQSLPWPQLPLCQLPLLFCSVPPPSMGPVHLCSPFLAGSGGSIQLHAELERCSRLSKDICSLQFLPLVTSSLLSRRDWQSFKVSQCTKSAEIFTGRSEGTSWEAGQTWHA